MLYNKHFYRYRNTKPSRAAQINWGHELARNLKGLWLFNEGGGGSVHDYTNWGANGRIAGTQRWTGGLWGSALLNTNTTGDLVNCGTVPHIRPVTNALNFSVAVWAYINDSSNAFRRILAMTENSVGPVGFVWIINFSSQANRAGFYVRNGATDAGKVTVAGEQPIPEIELTRNKWRCYVGTRDSSAGVTRAYIAGYELLTADAQGFGLDASSQLIFGNRGAGDRPFDGAIAAVAYWENRLITRNEAEWLEKEPYCFMAPSNQRRYFFNPAAAVGATDTESFVTWG